MRPTRIVAVTTGLALALVAGGGEPPDPLDGLLPGRAAGTIRSSWIAPYVQETQVSVGDGWITDLRWFRPDGSILREAKNAGATAEPGIVEGIRGTWSVRLRGPWRDSTILRGEDDSTLVHHWNEGESIRADVYKEGKLVGSVGPFPRFIRGHGFVLAEDGGMAVTTLKEPGSTSVRVVVFGPEGKPSFEADAGGDTRIMSVAPGGLGVVIQGNGEPYVEFTWLSKKGTSRTLKIEPNPWLSRWVPGTAQQVVTYGLAGKNPRFRLVDWESGKTVWDVADPAKGISSRMEGVAIEGSLVLLAGIETYPAWSGDWCRTSEALELGTGTLVGYWRSNGVSPPGLPVPRFMRLEGKLWLVADDAFAPFPVDQIRKKAGGWE